MNNREILTLAEYLHESNAGHGLGDVQVEDLIHYLIALGVGEVYLEGVVLAVLAGCRLSRRDVWERLHPGQMISN